MGEQKFAFCSEAWVEVANQYLKDASKGEDLSGIEYTFSEIFTDAPDNLGPDEQGRVGWYFRVANGQVEAKRGIIDDPDACVQADYASILPLARAVFEGNPEAAAQATKAVEEMTAAGRLVRTSKVESPPEMPWAGQLHDVLARHTL